MNITIHELHLLRDKLPAGSLRRIADELNLDEELVRSYFNGRGGGSRRLTGAEGDGEVVALDDSAILDLARRILDEPSA